VLTVTLTVVSDSPSRPTPPTGLGADGKQLWEHICSDVSSEVELDERDLAILAAASDLADSIRELKAAVKRDGRVLESSRGEVRVHPAVAEIRQAGQAQARLLGLIDMDLTGASQSAGSRKARELARRRWASAGQSRRGEVA
jgi:phage terminase small subunit